MSFAGHAHNLQCWKASPQWQTETQVHLQTVPLCSTPWTSSLDQDWSRVLWVPSNRQAWRCQWCWCWPVSPGPRQHLCCSADKPWCSVCHIHMNAHLCSTNATLTLTQMWYTIDRTYNIMLLYKPWLCIYIRSIINDYIMWLQINIATDMYTTCVPL